MNVLNSGIIVPEKQKTWCHCAGVGQCATDIDYFVGYLDGTYDILNS